MSGDGEAHAGGPTDAARLCRSFQTAPAAVPGDESAKYLRSGLTAEGFETPDWLVPDVEDGTAPDLKDEAVANAVRLLPEHAPDFAGAVWPRVEWAHDDAATRERGGEQVDRLLAEAGAHVDGVVVPKVGGADDVERTLERVAAAEADAGLAEGNVGVAVIVETARARSALRDVAALGPDSRLSALVFGPVDYAADLGARAVAGEGPSWPALLEALSNEASANGLLAIGGPYDSLFVERGGVTYYDAPGYAERVEREARVGLDGSWSLHPKQTVQANHVHAPSVEEVEGAVGALSAFEAAKAEGTGAVTVDGRMVDEATARTFRNVVGTVRAMRERVPEQAGELYDEALLGEVEELADAGSG